MLIDKFISIRLTEIIDRFFSPFHVFNIWRNNSLLLLNMCAIILNALARRGEAKCEEARVVQKKKITRLTELKLIVCFPGSENPPHICVEYIRYVLFAWLDTGAGSPTNDLLITCNIWLLSLSASSQIDRYDWMRKEKVDFFVPSVKW